MFPLIFPLETAELFTLMKEKKKKESDITSDSAGGCVRFFFSSRTPIKNLILKVHLCERKYSSKKVEYEFFCEKKYYNKKFKLL